MLLENGIVPNETAAARKWFRQKAKELNNSPSSLIGEAKTKRQTSIGRMYLFGYDPKWKKKLPYYDRYPLVFPIEKYGRDGFLGINLHYLPLNYRAKLMDALYELRSDYKYDEKTKLQMSYGILKGASKFKYFKPCIKHYLLGHVQTPYAQIHPMEWDTVLYMPLASWAKGSQSQVYKDSRKIIQKG